MVLAIALFLSAHAVSAAPEETWTDKTLNSLTLKEKIAQLVQIRIPGKFINLQSQEFKDIRDQIRRNRFGGVVLFAGNVYESAVLINELQAVSRLPLLVSADFERGAAFRIADTTSFPWAMALGATGSEDLAYRQGLVTAQESRALGVHWILAPVLDVNNNPDNPVINIRSFGEDPSLVARLGAAFIRGAKKGGVLTAAKHFPGHGDTAVDSHVGLPVVESDLERLNSIEFAPFRSAIEAGVDSIMTAHVAVPEVTGERKEPATLSPEILTGILRGTLKFQGLVVTDALEMAGITDRYWCGLAAVRAIQAGADVLLLPPDAAVAVNEIERAVQRGDITRQRINQSVRKILEAKRRLGLHQNRLVSIRHIGNSVASPQNIALTREIADRSITVVKDSGRLLPINALNDPRIFSLVLASDLETSPGALFQAEMRRRFPSMRTAWSNARVNDELLAAIDGAVDQSDLIVCSTLVRLTSGQDTISLPVSQRAIIKKLLASGKRLIWISFGNPYVLRLAPETGTYVCAFSYSEASQVAAARALAGEIDINGRMPVSIPDWAKAGDGLRIPRLDMILSPAPLEALGLPQDAFDQSRQILASAVETGVFSGASLVVGYQGKTALDLSVGKTALPAQSGAIYNLDSFSKTVHTASGIMLVEESGRLLPESDVTDYVPELKTSGKTPIRDLLKLLSAEDESGADASGSNTAVLEEIVTRASGVSADRFVATRLFDPLGMKQTFRNPSKNLRASLPGLARPPASSLFSTAGDLAVFAQMLLNGGIYDHRRYFSPRTVARYTGPQGAWSKPSAADWTGKLFSPSAFGRGSAEGSLIWMEPGKRLFIILLTTGRPESGEDTRIGDIQRALCESILAGIQRAQKPRVP
jgi:beta-glucosidase-like glycosyl hydrolase/CubicO group peptidase (beta-lactamase class C family)